MTDLVHRWSHYEAHITGFVPINSVIQGPRGVTRTASPIIELTIIFPHDEPRVVQVPFPIDGGALRRRLAKSGAIVMGCELRSFTAFLRGFARHVVENLGWYRHHSFPFMGPRYTRRHLVVDEVSA